MKKRIITLFLFISAAVFVYSQDETSRLLNLLDNVLNTAAEVGKSVPSPSQTNPENPTFNILNKTGFTVKNIEISQTNSTGQGILTFNGNLYNGQSARVTLKVPLSETNRYNIRLVDVDGARYSKQDVEITEYAVIEIRIGDFED
jgi:flagellin-like hook-associated protein FlgL